MNVKFIYPYKDGGFSVSAGDVKGVSHLSPNSAVFDCTYPMSLAVFFKITVPSKATKSVKNEPVKRFKIPTVDEVAVYCLERGNNIDAQAFVAHYTANGWVQGKGKPIKCWESCVITWEKGDSNNMTPSSDGSLQTEEDVLARLKKRQLTSIKQIPVHIRKVMETMYMINKYDAETMVQLKNIGFE